jgi:hypothetical protein
MACSVCEAEPVKARGFCAKHYRRWQRHGDPNHVEKVRADGAPADRWQRQIEIADCWTWLGTKSRGYGSYSVDGRPVLAHRWVYQHLVRRLDRLETLDHLCRNRLCVNPDHLEPVSHAVNVARGMSGQHNAVKTSCAQGHPYTPENTRHPRRGGRSCITCQRERNRESMRRRRQAARLG